MQSRPIYHTSENSHRCSLSLAVPVQGSTAFLGLEELLVDLTTWMEKGFTSPSPEGSVHLYPLLLQGLLTGPPARDAGLGQGAGSALLPLALTKTKK